MNVHYEELNDNIKLIHDVDTLKELRHYNFKMQQLFFSLIIDDTKKPVFECCREYMQYLDILYNVIDDQITKTLYDMERSQPADED